MRGKNATKIGIQVTFQRGCINFRKIMLAYRSQREFHNTVKHFYPLKKAGIFLYTLHTSLIQKAPLSVFTLWLRYTPSVKVRWTCIWNQQINRCQNKEPVHWLVLHQPDTDMKNRRKKTTTVYSTNWRMLETDGYLELHLFRAEHQILFRFSTGFCNSI